MAFVFLSISENISSTLEEARPLQTFRSLPGVQRHDASQFLDTRSNVLEEVAERLGTLSLSLD